MKGLKSKWRDPQKQLPKKRDGIPRLVIVSDGIRLCCLAYYNEDERHFFVQEKTPFVRNIIFRDFPVRKWSYIPEL